jgi:hypothetical protein
MSTSRENVLRMYKNMLKLAKSLPPEKKASAITTIRQEFRSHSQEDNNEVVHKLLKKAESSLGYMKIISPHIKAKQSGVTTIRFSSEEGKVTSKAYSNWTGSNMDPDSVKRHYNSLKRAGFQDNSHAKGIF